MDILRCFYFSTLGKGKWEKGVSRVCYGRLFSHAWGCCCCGPGGMAKGRQSVEAPWSPRSFLNAGEYWVFTCEYSSIRASLRLLLEREEGIDTINSLITTKLNCFVLSTVPFYTLLQSWRGSAGMLLELLQVRLISSLHSIARCFLAVTNSGAEAVRSFQYPGGSSMICVPLLLCADRGPPSQCGSVNYYIQTNTNTD